jgi:two-component system chemotaxis response regulator CheY
MQLNILIVEDDFSSRNLLSKILADYGNCDVTADGIEAVKAFKRAMKSDEKYDLVCLDIILPDKDGIEVLREIRKYEHERGIFGSRGTKIVMTTAVAELEKIKEAFRLQCESYIIKPLIAEKITSELKKLYLI